MNNSYLSTLLALAFFMSFSSGFFAQTPVDLTIGSATVDVNQTECLPVTVNNFTQIVTMQWSLRWDPALIGYAEVDFGSNPLGLNATHFNIPNDSTFRMSWLEPNNQLITLAGEQVLLSVCFTAVASGTTDVAFEQDIPTEFIGDQFMEVPANTTDGTVTIPETPLMSVLPGDTNLDGLVNATDLLNFGLAFGSTGPARENAQTSFNPQAASAWGISTPISEVDFAHIDANGDGVIDLMDKAVIETNYGMATDGAVPLITPGVATEVPFEVVGPDFTAGVVSEFFVQLPYQGFVLPGLYGISFQIRIDATEFDLSTFSLEELVATFFDVDPTNYTFIARPAANENDLIEVSITRLNQMNGIVQQNGGAIGRFYLTPQPAEADFVAEWEFIPVQLIDADETAYGLLATEQEVTVRAPLSAREPEWAKGITVGPNPVVGKELTISGVLADKVAKLMLVDMSNRTIGTYPAGTRSIDVSGLAAGTYYLRIQTRDTATLLARKIIVH